MIIKLSPSVVFTGLMSLIAGLIMGKMLSDASFVVVLIPTIVTLVIYTTALFTLGESENGNDENDI